MVIKTSSRRWQNDERDMWMTLINIFNLDNIDDLPDSLKSDLSVSKKRKRDGFDSRIIALFKKSKSELSIDELRAGYYRLYNDIKGRRQMTAKLYAMSGRNKNINKKPVIDRSMVKNGYYKLRDDFNG